MSLNNSENNPNDGTDDNAVVDPTTNDGAPESKERPVQDDVDSPEATNAPESPDIQPEVDFDAFLAKQAESLDTQSEILALIDKRREAIAKLKVLRAKKAQDLKAGNNKFVNPVERIPTPAEWSDKDIKRLVEAGVFNNEEDANTFKARVNAFNALIKKIRANMKKPIGMELLREDLEKTEKMKGLLTAPVLESIGQIANSVDRCRSEFREAIKAKFADLMQTQKDIIEETNSDPRVQEMDRVEAEKELAEFEKELRASVNFLASKHGNTFSELAKLSDNPETKDNLLNALRTGTREELFVLLGNLRADLVGLKKEGVIKNSSTIVPWSGRGRDKYFDAMDFLRAAQKESDDRLGKLGNEKLAETVLRLLDENELLKILYGSKNDSNNPFWKAFADKDKQKRANGRQNGGNGNKKRK